MKNLVISTAIALFLGLIVAAPPGGYPLKRTNYTFEVPLDHFASGGNSPTFNIKYLADAQYWNPMEGPIFFYAGNEGKVEGFWDNSGFLTDVLAPQHQALIIFGEHRYFGDSFPFDKKVALDKDHNKWLTVEQAMMDYVLLIKEIRYIYGASDKPVVVFGGSYGGMLASWLRMKYPATFQGAYASSAPILYFKDSGVPQSAFGDIITQDFYAANQNCPSIIKEAWGYLMDIKENRPTDYPALKTIFNTCTDITVKADVDNLYTYLMNGFSYMAMTDYPYETSFLNPMPANPVNAACTKLKDIPYPAPKSEKSTVGALSARETLVLQGVQDASSVYFNYKGQTPCNDISNSDATGQLDGAGWDVLACNQLAMPTTNGKDSMFLVNDPFDEKAFNADCMQKYGLTPRYGWVWDTFGGQNIQKDFQAHTNIIFTNGNLDPWSAGGVTANITGNPTINSILLEGSAHHLELRAPNDADPDDVKKVRGTISDTIGKWVSEYFTKPTYYQ